MNLDTIVTEAHPSLTGDDAGPLVLDILMLEQTWRCYPRAKHPSLAHQYLNAHAKTLGLGKGEVLALAPIDTFRWDCDQSLFAGLTFSGGVFLNGAVLRITNTLGAYEDLLFVEQATATLWNYPTQDYFYFAEHFPDAHVAPSEPE